MKDTSIYAREVEPDHISKLYNIINLSKAGAAASDSSLNIPHMKDALCAVFEQIHVLASEAVDIAESQPRPAVVKNAA